MELNVYPFDLALRYPFTISRHTYDTMKTIIVEMKKGRYTGFGEATTNPYYQSTEENLLEAFEAAAGVLSSVHVAHPAELWPDLEQATGGQYFALSALDCAAYDLAGIMHGRSFGYQFGMDYNKYPFTSYTLGIGKEEEIRAKIRDLPWPVYKIKLGSRHDLETLGVIRRYTDALLRVDANGGWERDEALEMAGKLKGMDVEFIEQPLPEDAWEDMKWLKSRSPLPLIADESCQREEDVEKCIGFFDGINIKLAKCGGLTPALRMIHKAREAGLKIMIGCMTESTVGMAAAAQLLPLVDYADLDGPLLLKEDVATGIKYRNGFIKLKKAYGLGINFKYEKFETTWE